MKTLKDFINESCSKKNCKPRKFNKKVFDLIRSGKYKFHDKKLKDAFDKASKNITEKLSVDEFEDTLQNYIGELEDWVSSTIDDWASYWDGQDDMERDLGTAHDYFDNNWNEFIDSLDFGGLTKSEINKITKKLEEASSDIIDNYVSETEDYANDTYDWDDDDEDDDD